MARILIAGASETARSQLAGLLSASGHEVFRVCSGTSELRRCLNDCEDGILVLAGALPGTTVDELYWDYGAHVQILLIARPPVLEACEATGVFRMALPASPHAVLGAVEMLTQLNQMRMPRRTGDNRELVEQAKRMLMRRDHLTEPQAHRAMQAFAMNHGLRMVDYARQILEIMQNETEE